MSWTAVKFATAAAHVFGFDEEGKTRLHRVTRNMIAKGVLPTTPDPNDGRGALLFDDKVAAVALLLIPMADMDITVRGLRDAASYMLGNTSDAINYAPLGETVRPPAKIELALAAAFNKKNVELVTRLTWHARNAKITRDSRFEIEGSEPTGAASEIISAYKTVAITQLAELRIPASELLSAFFDESS